MIDAIIFDLDTCLAAASEPGRHMYNSAFDAISAANDGTVSPEVLRHAFDELWRVPFDFVARKFGFTESMVQAGWNVFKQLEVTTPMAGYGDLSVLKELPVKRFLVTSGFRRLQESKVRALGIAPLFSEIVIDAIDKPNARGKEPIFRELIQRHNLAPAATLVAGDNPDSELTAARRIGLRTVQTLRPGVTRDPAATHHVRNLHELKVLITT